AILAHALQIGARPSSVGPRLARIESILADDEPCPDVEILVAHVDWRLGPVDFRRLQLLVVSGEPLAGGAAGAGLAPRHFWQDPPVDRMYGRLLYRGLYRVA